MINTVYAASTNGSAAHAPSMLPFIIMMAVLFGLFYLMTYRPRQKREREQQNMLHSLNRGDEVITYAGLMGKIVKLTDEYVMLNIAENVNIKLKKNSIANILPKGTLNSIE